MESERTRQVAAALRRKGDAGLAAIADAVVQAWTLVDHELAPIVGTAGVAALYRRSLHLCAGRHPALHDALGVAQRSLDTAPLHAVLLAQDAATAARIGAEILLTFDELLSRMVGPSLTERLLRMVWKEFQGDAPTEDPLP
jgi:hypothetical protein